MDQNSVKSDIGNLYKVLDAIRCSYKGEMDDLQYPVAFSKDKKNDMRNIIYGFLHYKLAYTTLNPASLNITEKEYYSEEDVEFDVREGVRAQGILLIPKNRAFPLPAIVAMHDHGGFYYYGKEKIIEQDCENPLLSRFKDLYYGGRSWASEMAKKGYIVLCIDAFYFGSRKIDIHTVSEEIMGTLSVKSPSPEAESYMDDYNTICKELETLVVKHIFVSGTTWPGILLNDDIRSVDYLCTRKEVDKTRIGCCGLSIGGFRSAMLAALDTRISCAVVAGWVTTFESMLFSGLLNHTYMVYIPGLTRIMDFPDLVGLTASRPLFIQQCSRDNLFKPDGMLQACKVIEKCYEDIDQRDHFKYSFYSNGHQFNANMQDEAFKWFNKWFQNGR